MSLKFHLHLFAFSTAGAIATIVVWILAFLGKGSKALLVASGALRYIATFLPPFPLVRAIMAIAQVILLLYHSDSLEILISLKGAFCGYI